MLSKAPDTRFLDWKVQNTEHHLEQLKKRIPWQRFKSTKRMVCSLGSDYGYSDHVTKGHSFDYYPPLKALMEKLNKELGTNFNSALLNWYPKGEYVGINWHSDNESDLVAGQPVASVSLGEECIFELADGAYGRPVTESIAVPLKDGDVFIMGANCQKVYFHRIGYKKMKENRISLTFRCFK